MNGLERKKKTEMQLNRKSCQVEMEGKFERLRFCFHRRNGLYVILAISVHSSSSFSQLFWISCQ